MVEANMIMEKVLEKVLEIFQILVENVNFFFFLHSKK